MVQASKGDQLVWVATGDTYVVARVVNPPRGLVNLDIHRKVQARAQEALQ